MAELNNNEISQELNEAAERLAEKKIQEQQKLQNTSKNGKTFTRFDRENDIVQNQKQLITDGIWTNSEGSLSTFFTSSEQTDYQKRYYYEVHQSSSVYVNSEPQFSVTFGNYYGSGSKIVNRDYPTKVIYNQHRMMLLDEKIKFSFDGADDDNIYVININRSRYKDRLDEGNIQLALSELDGNNTYAYDGEKIPVSGSNKIIKLIDDSSNTEDVQVSSNAGIVYDMVSGSINEGVYNSDNPHIFGKFYPDMGIVVLSGNVLDKSGSFATNTNTDVTGSNAHRLFTSISGAASINTTQGSFYARNKETLTSTHYFVRVKNAEYNYSNNPSFTTGSYGDLRIPSFVENPRTYITTVGLYNDRRELMAVAKLSQPLIKSFYNELLIKVKLEF